MHRAFLAFVAPALLVAGCTEPSAAIEPPTTTTTGPPLDDPAPVPTGPESNETALGRAVLPEGFTWDGFLPARVCIPEGVGACEAFFGPRKDEEDAVRGQAGWPANASADLSMRIDWEPQGPHQEQLRASVSASGPCSSAPRCEMRWLVYEVVRPGDALEVPLTLMGNETTVWYQLTWDFPGSDPVRYFAYADQDFTWTVEKPRPAGA